MPFVCVSGSGCFLMIFGMFCVCLSEARVLIYVVILYDYWRGEVVCVMHWGEIVFVSVCDF